MKDNKPALEHVIYPSGLGDCPVIGITAPSSGLGNDIFIQRYETVASQLLKKGYRIKEGRCLRENRKHVSASSQDRASDLMNLWCDPSIGAIIPPWGGEILIEILDKINFDQMAEKPPKWILGYSDTSTLLFAITIMTGIATAHGINFMDLIDSQTDPLSRSALDILSLGRGESVTQLSSKSFQTEFVNFSDNLETPYNLTEKTEWKAIDGAQEVHFSGRLIGGCIDVIGYLVGTAYGDLESFKTKHEDHGVILYLENCQLSPCALTRALRQMQYAKWFTGLNGIIVGRNAALPVEDPNALNYVQALTNCFKDIGCPVVYDADIGHQPPNMTLINGALAELSVTHGTAKLIQHLV